MTSKTLISFLANEEHGSQPAGLAKVQAYRVQGTWLRLGGTGAGRGQRE